MFKTGVVVLFDGLDRLADISAFQKLIQDDLRALAQAGIGCVIVAPARILLAENRAIVDQFDSFLAQSALDVESDEASRTFLEALLTKRFEGLGISSAEIGRIALASGGFLRDAIAIAHLAVENAFGTARDSIEASDVTAAIDQFGRQFIIGLRTPELAVLQDVSKFVPTTDSDFALLASRRVVEYRSVPPRYVVHPTLRPLLQVRAGK